MSDLAITGENPVAPDGLTGTDWPIFDDSERRALSDVLESERWCSLGPEEGSKVADFEATFAEYIGTEHATAVPNGTQALQLAFRAIGLQPGEEVIVPAATFVASASSVVLANGVPRFVDIDPETYQLSPEAVEAAITDRTRAIEVVHYGGYPANMDRLREIADEHDLYIVEDAAEAHGTEWRGEKVGSIGDVGCFSLQQFKPLTCGEGGVITYDGDDLAERVYAYANLGRSPSGNTYEHHVPAGNFRLSEFLGAILLEQFSRFTDQTERRDENGQYLTRRLESIEGISTLKDDPRITQRGYYFYFLRYDPARWRGIHRDTFIEALNAEGIPCSTAHNDPLYRHEAFRDIDDHLLHGAEVDYESTHCPETERIYESEAIALPKDVLMERADVDVIVEAIEKLWANRDALETIAEESDR